LVDLPAVDWLPGKFKIGVEDEVRIAKKHDSSPPNRANGSHREIILATDQMLTGITSDGPSGIEKNLGIIFHVTRPIKSVNTSHRLRLDVRHTDGHGE
jgi:hypothetical protein